MIMRPRLALFVAPAAAIALLVACSSSSGSGSPGAGQDGGGGEAGVPCNQNPFECPAGQTCWPASGGGFACLMSNASAKKGDVCQNYAGSATCGDGLMCYEPNTSSGVCAPYCDNAMGHPCAAGELCALLHLPNAGDVHACVAIGSDASADGAGG